MSVTDTPLSLLVFAPCERVIIGSEGDNSTSLIAILQGFAVAPSDMPSATKEPRDEKTPIPLIPMGWHVYALWENDDSGRTFHQRFELRSPSGRVLMQGETDFTLEAGKRFHRLSGKLPGFPLDGFGEYQLVLLLKSGSGEFVERARFPIPIITGKTT